MEDQTDGRTKLMEDKSDFSVETKQNQGLIRRLISGEIVHPLNPLNGTYIYEGCFCPVMSSTPYI